MRRARAATPHLMPVGVSGIPRADAQITRTMRTFAVAQFEHDGLWEAHEGFKHSLMGSAEKREGAILEAAIMDAIDTTPELRLVPVSRKLARRPDIQFEVKATGWLVALEVKRGAKHDSKGIRQFRADLDAIPALLRNALPLFPAENVHFHIVFVFGEPPIREGLRLADLGRLYGLHATSHVLTARQRFSAAVHALFRERGV